MSKRSGTLILPLFALVALAIAAPGPAARAGDGKAKKISASEALDASQSGEEVLFVDTRISPSGYMIPGAVSVPVERVEEWAEGVDRDALVVAYCT